MTIETKKKCNGYLVTASQGIYASSSFMLNKNEAYSIAVKSCFRLVMKGDGNGN